ncbi:MAG: Ig-like domain-containing protein [Verrucomicrobiales bacterium]|nr:Ig-like domain-containing protein [Verrucomicrobiales bacterium]
MIRLLLLIFLTPCCFSAAKELRSVTPANGSTAIDPGTTFNLQFHEAIDTNSLQHIQIRSGGKAITVKYSTDLTNASITVVPVDFLEPDRDYILSGEKGLKTAAGKPVSAFRLLYQTGAAARVGSTTFDGQVFDKTRSMTTVLFGPDRKLYAASAFGELVCYDVDASGKPSNRTTIIQDKSTSRQYIDLEWDPAASSDNLILWVSYAERLTPKRNPGHFFTGEIAKLTIKEKKLTGNQVIVTGLPHGREKQGDSETLPHQPNGLCFKGGKLYQSVGSTSSSGGPPNWGLKEQAFSACIIEIDYQDIKTTVDLFQVDSHPRVRRFATGVRNALEIVAHSNGNLYTAVNINDRAGRRDGVPDDPDIPGDQNELIKATTPDHESLYILERGRHYGFPNPSIGNYVLGGGNPTASDLDPFQIGDYPVGTQPEKGFAPELMYPLWQYGGTSPNGMIEYRPEFRHPLSGALLCCFYSANSIAVMPPGENGMPGSVKFLQSRKGRLQCNGPLDITQDPKSGCLYIADFGKQRVFGKDGSMLWLAPSFQKPSL